MDFQLCLHKGLFLDPATFVLGPEKIRLVAKISVQAKIAKRVFFLQLFLFSSLIVRWVLHLSGRQVLDLLDASKVPSA